MTSEALTRLNAALEGRYRLERELGEGGMATVYLADDLRHERKVALKVLKPELAAVVGAERFLAEIKTTANLQHPHILPLFDSGEADQFLFYVMPYVEGESLRERLDRERQLPVDEAVEIARNVAEALDYAHSRGVIHRDIKPANIMSQAGKPVISDFGIALALSAGGGTRLTETGLSLGTPHYMSPEQATGDLSVGAATDIYALGCVLYEMLVGEPPFTGSTPQAILGKIIAGELASTTEQRPSVPANVDAAIKRALERVPADRFVSAGEFARSLSDPGFTSPAYASTDTPKELRWWRAAALGSAVALAVTLGWSMLNRTPDLAVAPTPFTYQLPGGQRLATWSGAVALSRDGHQLAYSASGQLYVKRMTELEARAVPGASDDAQAPFFSPDGREIAFVAAQQLWKIPTAGGSPVPLGPVGFWFYGGSWGEDGRIVLATDEGVMSVPSGGGQMQMLVPTTDPEDAFGPRILPGGEWLLFTLATRSGSNRWHEARVVAQSLGSDERRLVTTGSDARYLSTGHLLYAVEDALYGVEFDLRSLSVTGVPAVIAAPVQRAGNPIYNGGTANYAISESGTFAYVPRISTAATSLVSVDRRGDPALLTDLGDLTVAHLRVSPDGGRLVLATSEPGDIWVYEIATQRLRQLTRDGGNRWPEWVNDDVVAYTSGRAGADNIFVQRWDRADEPEQLTDYDVDAHLNASSADGRLLALHKHPPPAGSVVPAILSLNSQPGQRIALTSEAELPIPGIITSFSPSGEWIAYMSEADVFLTPSSGAESRVPISTEGGEWAVWTGSDEVFYRNGDQVVAVAVTTQPAMRTADPVILFDGQYARGPGAGNFDVGSDGQTFFMVVQEDADPATVSQPSQINIVLNWFEELRQRTGS